MTLTGLHMCFMLPYVWSALFNLRCLQWQLVSWQMIPRDVHHLLSPHLDLASLFICVSGKQSHSLNHNHLFMITHVLKDHIQGGKKKDE